MSRLPHLPPILIALIVLSLTAQAYEAYSEYFLLGDFDYTAIDYGGVYSGSLRISKNGQFCSISPSSGTDYTCWSKDYDDGKPFLYTDLAQDPNDGAPYAGYSNFIEGRATYGPLYDNIIGYSAGYQSVDYYSGSTRYYGTNYGYSQMDLLGNFVGNSDKDLLVVQGEKDAGGTTKQNKVTVFDLDDETDDEISSIWSCDDSLTAYGGNHFYYDSIVSTDADGDGRDDYVLGAHTYGDDGPIAVFILRGGTCSPPYASYTYVHDPGDGYSSEGGVQVAEGNLDVNTGNREFAAISTWWNGWYSYLNLAYGRYGRICNRSFDITGLIGLRDGNQNVKIGDVDNDADNEVAISVSGNSGSILMIFEITFGGSCSSDSVTYTEYEISDSGAIMGIDANTIRDIVDIPSSPHKGPEVVLTYQDNRFSIDRFSVLSFDDTLTITPIVSSTVTRRRQDTDRTSIVGGLAYSEVPIQVTNTDPNFNAEAFRLHYESTGSDDTDYVYFDQEIYYPVCFSGGGCDVYTHEIEYDDDSSLEKLALFGSYGNDWQDSGNSVLGGDAYIDAKLNVSNSDKIEYNAYYDYSHASSNWCRPGWPLHGVDSGYVSVPAKNSSTTSNYPIHCKRSGILPISGGNGWQYSESGDSKVDGQVQAEGRINASNSGSDTLLVNYDNSIASSVERSGWTCTVDSGTWSMNPGSNQLSPTYPVKCSRQGVVHSEGGENWTQDGRYALLAGGTAYIVGDTAVKNDDAEVTFGSVSKPVLLGTEMSTASGRTGWDCSSNDSFPGITSISPGQEISLRGSLFCQKDLVINTSGFDWTQLSSQIEANGPATIQGKLRITNTDAEFGYTDIHYNNSSGVREGWNCSVPTGVISSIEPAGYQTPTGDVNCTGVPLIQNVTPRVQDHSQQATVGSVIHSTLNLTVRNTDDIDYHSIHWKFNNSTYDGFAVAGQTEGTINLNAGNSFSSQINLSKSGLIVFEDVYENATDGYVLNLTVRNHDSINYTNITVPISVNESKLKGAPVNLTMLWNGSWQEITPTKTCAQGGSTFGAIKSCMEDTNGSGFADTYYVIQPNSSEAKYHLKVPDFEYSSIQRIYLHEGNGSYCGSDSAINVSSSGVYSFTGSDSGFLYIRKIDDTVMTVRVDGDAVAQLEANGSSTGCIGKSWRTYRIPVSSMGEVELIGDGYVDFLGFQPSGECLLYPENSSVVAIGFSIEPSLPNISINGTEYGLEGIYLPSNEFSNFYYGIFRTNNTSSVISTELMFEGWVSPSREIETDAEFPMIGDITYPGTDLFLDQEIHFSAQTPDKNLNHSYLKIGGLSIPLNISNNNSTGVFVLDDLGISKGNDSLELYTVDEVGHVTNISIPVRLSSFTLNWSVFPGIIAMWIYADSVSQSHDHSAWILMEQTTSGTAVNVSKAINFTLNEPWVIDSVFGNLSWTANGDIIELVSRNYSLDDHELIGIAYNISDAFSIVSKHVSPSEKLVLIDNITLNTSVHQIPNLFINVSLPKDVNLSEESIALSVCGNIDVNDRFDCEDSWTPYPAPYALPTLMEPEFNSSTGLADQIVFRLRRSSGTLIRIEIQTGSQGPERTPEYLELSDLLTGDYHPLFTEFNLTEGYVTVGDEYMLNLSFTLSPGSEAVFDGISVPDDVFVDGYPSGVTTAFNQSIIVDSEYGPLTEVQFSVRNLPLVLVEETNSSHGSQSNTHTFTQGIRVLADAVSNGSIVYNFFTSSLPDFSKRIGDPTVRVDGSQNNISWQVVGGGNIIRLIVGENFGNSSLHEGNHTVTIEYDTESGGDEEESPPGGGTPPGSGGLALIPMYANVSWPSKLSMYRDATSELSIYIDNADGKTSTYTFNYSSEVNITPKVTSMVLNPDEIGILRFTINPQNTPLNSSLLQFTLTEVHAGQKTYAKKAFNLTLVFTDRPEVESNDTPDSTPPDITAIEPANNSLIDSSYFTLNLTTDENAECRYSDSLDRAFAEMSIMDSTGNTFHQHAFNLSDGANYTYYFKCRDSEGNVNAFDYGLNFTIKKQETPDSGPGPNPNPPLIPADLNTLSLLLSLLVALAMISYQLIAKREEPVILIPREKVDFIKPPVKRREMKKFGIKVPGVVEGRLVTETEKKPEPPKRKEKKPMERKPEPVKEEKKPEKPVKEEPKPERKEGKGSEFGTPEELKKAEEELKKYFMEEG